MKLTLFFSLYALFIVVDDQDYCLKEFNAFLGIDKAKVLNEIVNEIDIAIGKNDTSSYADQHRKILQKIAFGPDRRIKFDIKNRIQIQHQIKSTGLDSAIWEQYYEKLNEKKVLVYNIDVYGKFAFALKETLRCDQDSMIQEYLTAIEAVGNISSSLIAKGALENFEDRHFHHPIIKRILVAELYIHYFLYPKE